MTQKALLQSAGDGTAIAAGYALETVTINLSGTPAAVSTWYGYAGQSITLTRGSWILLSSININTTACPDFSAGLSTNSNNDASGLITSVQQAKTTTSPSASSPLILTQAYNVTSASQVLYLKNWMTTATGPVSITGLFIRIA
jgi:hypothetical protein